MSEQNKPEDEKKGAPGKEPSGSARSESKPTPGKGAKAAEKGVEAPPKKGEPTPKAAKRPEPEKTAAAPAVGTGRGLAIAALVIAIAAGAGAGYLWQELQKTRGSIEAMHGATTDRIDQLQGARDSLAGRVEAQQDGLAQLRQGLQGAERERDALTQAMRHLRTRLSQDRSEWTLAEVEYLLTIANHSLQLQGNVRTAIAALQAADQRLAQQADPALIPVREAIADELQQLRAVPRTDTSGIAARLGSLMASVPELPLTGDSRTGAGAGELPAAGESPRPEGWSDWRGWLSAIWTELKGLVTVKHADEVGRPLMSPEQQYFLRQNLRLKLETARTALLEGQPAVYRDALNEAAQWVSEYFQTEAGTSRAFLQTLKELAQVQLKPELPDVSESLRVLRRTADELGRASGQPPAAGEEAAQ